MSSLAEVGIGINLAFGVVQSFRNWLKIRVSESVSATSARVLAELAEVSPSNKKSIAKVEGIAAAFAIRTERLQPWFVFVAILSAAALIAFLAYITVHGSDACADWWVYPMLFLVVGPVGLWWLLIGLLYGATMGHLYVIERGYRNGIAAFKELTDRTPEPVEPGGPNGQE